LEIWNNLSKDIPLQVGQTLFIPSSDTEGYHTPTPVGMVQLATPDSEGRITHIVQEYQTLTAIAQVYGVQIQSILALNGIQAKWPLSVGQELVIDLGFVTPNPTLRPIERLTPESDGRYYHIVQLGESLSWIASLYEVTVTELMAWNGLDESSVLQPDQRLLLQVTPPATETPTTTPDTPTLTPTASSTATPPSSPTLTAIEGDADAGTSSESGNAVLWVLVLGLLAGGSILVMYVVRRMR
jgi:LysM repeat protein